MAGFLIVIIMISSGEKMELQQHEQQSPGEGGGGVVHCRSTNLLALQVFDPAAMSCGAVSYGKWKRAGKHLQTK